MKIACPHCCRQYRLKGDVRLSAGRIVSIPCPHCKGKIPLELQQLTGENGVDCLVGADGPALKEVVLRRMTDLPTMPQLVFRAQQIMADPAADLKVLSRILKSEPSMVARVLRMANSAYFGLSGKVASFEHAAVLLGQKLLGEIVAMVGANDLLGRSLPGYRLNSGDLWRHSMAVAIGSRMIAEQKYADLAPGAFVAGLLHDVGKMILDRVVLERRELFDAFMADEGATFLEAEVEILGFDHCEIAAEMCRRWHIPEPVCQAIGHHHYPSRLDRDPLASILHLADYVATLSGIGVGSEDDILYKREDGVSQFLELDQKSIRDLMYAVIEACTRIDAVPVEV